MQSQSVKVLPHLFRSLEKVSKSYSVMDNNFRCVLDAYKGDDYLKINKHISCIDTCCTLKNFDSFRVMLGILPPKSLTYHHLNRHIKILEGNLDITFDLNDTNRFAYDKKNALTIASPHYLINTDEKESTYIWIEETPKHQSPLII